jgi:hypothetical protein
VRKGAILLLPWKVHKYVWVSATVPPSEMCKTAAQVLGRSRVQAWQNLSSMSFSQAGFPARTIEKVMPLAASGNQSPRALEDHPASGAFVFHLRSFPEPGRFPA